MALIASLAVALIAQTGQFSAKMQGASKTVDTFAGRCQAAQKKILDFGKTYAVPIAAATGLLAVVKASAEAVEQNLNLAEKLETTYNQMKTLRVAADMAGGSIESMTGAVEELQKRLGEGGSAIGQALGKIGLSTGSLLGKGSYEQILLISNGIKGLTSAEQRAAVAADLFGKKSKDLINLFMLGSDGIKDAEGYVRRTGQAMEDTQASGVRKLNDALQETWDTTKGLGEQFTVMVKGPLTALVSGINVLYQALVALPRAWNAANQGIDNMIGKGPAFEESYTKIAITMATLSGNSDLANGLQADLGESRALRKTRGSGLKDDAQIAELQSKRLQRVANENSMANRTASRAAWDDILVDAKGRLGLAWMGVQSIMEKGAKAAMEKAATESAASESAFKILRLGIGAQMESAVGFWENILDRASADRSARAGLKNTLSGLSLGPGNATVSAVKSASAGTRGTFASDTAGRSVASFSIEKEQLEVQKDMLREVENLNKNINGGLPVG